MSLYKIKTYDKDKNYTEEINKAEKAGNIPLAERLERERNAKIDGEGLNYGKTYKHIDLGDELELDMQSGKSPQEVYQKAMLRYDKAINTPGLSQYAYDDIQKRAMQYYTEGMSQRPTYENKKQTTVDDLWEQVMNAPDFSYNAENDPVFQSYKDMYTREGQRTMQDTLASLSIDAGGENSWAVSAAAQAQNRYMQELADKVPELYKLAYDRYLTERNADMKKLDLARDMENTDYSRYLDEVNFKLDERDYYDRQMDKWNKEAQQYKLDALTEVENYINAGVPVPQDVLLRAGITDPSAINALIEQQRSANEYNQTIRDYELAGLENNKILEDLALQKALGQYQTPTVVKGGNPGGNPNEPNISTERINKTSLKMFGLENASLETIEKMVEDGKLIAEEKNGEIILRLPTASDEKQGVSKYFNF